MHHRTALAMVITLAVPSLLHAQCDQLPWGDAGSGVGAGMFFTNTFAVAGVGTRFEVLSEPTSGAPTRTAFFDIGKEIKRILSIGGSASWASDGTSLWCFDRINAATSPLRLRSTFTPPGGIRDFILVGLTAYVWQGTTLSVINYTDTANPFISSTIQLPQAPFEAAFLNNRLYLLAAGRTLEILDVTDPANPAFIRSVSLGGTVLNTVSAPAAIPGTGTLVHFAFYQSSIAINQNLIRVLDIDNDQLTGAAGSVTVSGTPVQITGNFMLTTQGLFSVNWTNPLAPTFGTLFTDTASRFRAAGFSTSSGVTRAFIAASEGGLLAVNANTGVLQTRYQPQPGNALEVATGPGGVLYVADGLDGLRTVTASDGGAGSRSIAPTGGAGVAGTTSHVATGDAFAAVISGGNVQTFGTTNPGSPPALGTYAPASSSLIDVAASGSSLLVLRSSSGTILLDLLRGAGGPPSLRSSQPVTIDASATPQRVRAFGNLAVAVSSLDARLFSFNAAAPLALTPRGGITIGAALRDAAVSGNTLYLLDSAGQVHVVDITNPDAPGLIRSVSVQAGLAGASANGDWLAAVGPSLWFINISDRSRPVPVASAALPNATATSVSSLSGPSGPHFLVAAGLSGVRAFAAPTDWSPQITAPPTNTTACRGGTATFTVAALTPNTPANPTMFQWNRVGAGGGPIPGATGPTLIITGATPADAAFGYTVTVTNSCGSATSPAATLTNCRADVNCSGAVSVQDIFDFLALFFAEDPRADFNGAAGITVQDLFDFLSAYFAGC